MTHSPRREVVSGPATQRVPTPRLLGDAKRWCCFGRHTLPSRTVALITQSYPAALEVPLLQRGCNRGTELDGGTSRGNENFLVRRARVRDDSACAR